MKFFRLFALFSLAAAGTLSCLGKDQIHGMLHVDFSTVAVCLEQERFVQFRNNNGGDLVIEGAAINVGSDPGAHFQLQSILVGTAEIEAFNDQLNNIVVPAGFPYTFKILYAPRKENETHEAILDVAYRSPDQGIIQIVLQGSSAPRDPGCPATDEIPSGPVSFDGPVLLWVEKIVLINAKDENLPISSESGRDPFEPVPLRVELAAEEGNVLLPEIMEEDGFVLPPPAPEKLFVLSNIIHHPTTITSLADASGQYDASNGSLTVEDIEIHLRDAGDPFEADLAITLTTESTPINDVQPGSLIGPDVGFVLSEDETEVLGKRIDAETGRVELVGTSRFENVQTSSGILALIEGETAVVRIEGRVEDPDLEGSDSEDSTEE